jgi:hypothetical protein
MHLVKIKVQRRKMKAESVESEGERRAFLLGSVNGG